ncbi:iron-dependent repressor [Nonlabens spongiae]|uniref:Transcriptional regulator MntR n=1 Tax=Nonlabens spongiae TaxID=331648 RepID=A0A1W6MKJ1_9FLAO|nr:metal-dependent transcriptional regulator [Nonlabens spongiae]ARN78128.1 iron-dependent repressor [Nonlabens spongiae]
MHSISEENYIKAIYHAQQASDLVSTTEIASRMNTRASSVTDMLKKLADKNLVEYVPYKGAKLTKNGRSCAMQIIRKHRLWEVFLVEKLDFTWDEVHEIAEQLEHIQSRKLIDELDRHLGYPKKDPHGDPIPDSEGNLKEVNQILLSKLPSGTTGMVTGVIDTSTEFLRYLDKYNLHLGSVVEILEIEEYDQSLKVKFDNKQMTLTQQTAEKLYIQKK